MSLLKAGGGLSESLLRLSSDVVIFMGWNSGGEGTG